MKYLFLCAMIVCSIIEVQAQSTRLYYLKNGFETQDKNQAYYHRDITKINNKTYVSIQYTPQGIKQAESYLESVYPYLPHGMSKFYYPNNQLMAMGNYEHGRMVGEWERFYSNSQLKEKGKYVKMPVKQENVRYNQQRFILETYKDSTGNTLVENGFGSYKSYHPDGTLCMEGNYENGEKAGLWIGYFTNKKKYFEETYKKGILTSGISYDSLGNKYNYKELEQIGSFIGGQSQMYNFLSKHIKYPAEALAKNIEGRVLLSFTLEANGSVSEINIVSSPDHSLTREAVRVLLLMNDQWIPGRSRGQAIKTRYNLPVAFKR